jgi:glycerate 2-kinase
VRVLIAPDKFAGTLTAVQAAEAIAEGWLQGAPGDEVDLVPMADGGPGFVDVLHQATGGELVAVTVRGPLGEPVPATMLLVNATAYLESAQACGRHLVKTEQAEEAGTYGVGELVSRAIDAGATQIVVGLGGSGTTDGGAGALAALGAIAAGDLTRGSLGLSDFAVDLGPVREMVSGIRLVAAADVQNPLTGLFGAAKVYGPQKGISAERLPTVDARLEAFSMIDRRMAMRPGAGAAGGLGFALMMLGSELRPGLGLVADVVGLAERARQADLVLTGEGCFDFSSRAGKVPYGVAEIATAAIRPCVVLAGQVLVGAREMRALGIEAAYSVADLVGVERSLDDSAASLSALAARTARNWSRWQ